MYFFFIPEDNINIYVILQQIAVKFTIGKILKFGNLTSIIVPFLSNLFLNFNVILIYKIIKYLLIKK